MPSEPADAEADAEPYWADAVLGDTELDIHRVGRERYLDVYQREDGRLLFDECWREAFLVADADAALDLEAWR